MEKRVREVRVLEGCYIGTVVQYSSNPRRKMCCYRPCRLGFGVSKPSLLVRIGGEWGRHNRRFSSSLIG